MMQFTFGSDKIQQALDRIVESGHNQVLCSITGVPIGTIDSEEIRIALEMDYRQEMCSVERLIDLWDMRHWVMASRPAPALRLINKDTYSVFLRTAPNGDARLLAYELSRMIFPGDTYNSLGRFTFLRSLHESLRSPNAVGWPEKGLAAETFRLILTLDSLNDIDRFYKNSAWRGQFHRRILNLQDMVLTEPHLWDWEKIYGLVSDTLGFAFSILETFDSTKGSVPAGLVGNRLIISTALAHMQTAPAAPENQYHNALRNLYAARESSTKVKDELNVAADVARASLGLKKALETPSEKLRRLANAGKSVKEGAQHTNDSILRIQQGYIDRGEPVPESIATKAEAIRKARWGTEKQPKPRPDSEAGSQRVHKTKRGTYDRAALEKVFRDSIAKLRAANASKES